MDNKVIQRKYARDFRKLNTPRSIFECLMILGGHIGSAAIATYFSVFVWGQSIILGAIVFVFVLFFIGTRYRALSNILHECTHGCFAASAKANTAFAHVLCILLFFSLSSYKKNHRTHHAFTGEYDKDLEFGPIEHYELHKLLNWNMLVIHIKRTYNIRHIYFYTGKVWKDLKDPSLLIVMRSIYILGLLGSCLYFGLTSTTGLVILGYVFLPLMTSMPLMMYAMDILDHGGLLGSENIAHRARNYTTKSFLLNKIIFPHNDTYHLVHHLFPDLQTRALPECHRRLLASEEEYAGMTHDLPGLVREILSSDRRILPEKMSTIDT